MNRITRLAAVAALLVSAAPTVLAKGGEARLRVIHASPDAPAVDVLVNGAPAITDLSFSESSGYAALPAGRYDVQVVPAGLTSPVVIDLSGAGALNLLYNRDYTALAVDTLSSIEPLLLADDNRPAPVPFARVRFVHASPDAPAVDVCVTNGPCLFQNIAFRGVGDYVEVPRGSYDLEVRVAGTQVVALTLPGIRLDGGTTYTAVAIGFAAGTPSLDAALFVDSRSPAKGRGPKN